MMHITHEEHMKHTTHEEHVTHTIHEWITHEYNTCRTLPTSEGGAGFFRIYAVWIWLKGKMRFFQRFLVLWQFLG